MVIGNVTGWNELINGSIFSAATIMFNGSFEGWFITLIFFAFKTMLYMGTKSLNLSFTTTLFFASVFIDEVDPILRYTLVSVLVLEMAAILYKISFKK